MAKIDIANEIVTEFPDKGYEAEKLKDSHTEAELLQLQEDLRKESTDEVSESPQQPTVEEYTGVKYKLKDPNTQFSEGSFTLSGDQEKELPENPSPDLLARVRSGFLVEVK